MGRPAASAIAVLSLMGLMACGEPEGAGPAAPAAAPVRAGPGAEPGAGPVTAGTTVRPESRSFRDWRAVCDNGNACVAYTGTDTGGWLMVRQAAGPEARPQILAGLSAFAGEDVVIGVRLTVDGQVQTLSPGPDGTHSYEVPAGRVPAMLARLASARTVMVGLGETRAGLPAAGASAALLWIDERQGRLDTTSALLRRGSGAATAVPAAAALPRIQATASVDQAGLAGAANPGRQGDEAGIALAAPLEALADVRQCREDTAYNEYLQKAVLAGRLSAETELWGVPCGSGAYNAMYDLYVSGPNGANPRRAVFPGFDGRAPLAEEGDIVGDSLVNPVFDARTNTVSHFSKGRGIGDCGLDQTWTWTGRAFVLTREASMGECWGIVPDLWPTTWRTR